MTRLLIAGQEVILPMDFNATVTEENPFFTKNGVYTQDITLSLLIPENAKIYHYLHRFNHVSEIDETRSAYMVVDNEVVINGTEIIIGWTDKSVTIQLASGNSELNFLIGGDRKLRNLDLGKADIKYGPTFQDRNRVQLAKTYPEVNWQILPYYTWEVPISNENKKLAVGNYYDVMVTAEGFLYPHLKSFHGQITPQPYLCFIVNKVIEVLGYKVINNDIATHRFFKNMYLVNGIQTRVFAEMLPDWTVNEFLSKIELFFDCIFMVNKEDKTVDIFFNYKSNAEYQNTTTLEVYDEYIVEKDSENNLDIRKANTAYDLDNDEYSKFASLNPKITERAIFKPYASFPNLSWLVDYDKDKKKKIYTHDEYGDFISYDRGMGLVGTLATKVNHFAPLMNNPESTEIDNTLDIVPASMEYTSAYADSSPGLMRFWHQVPCTQDFDPLDFSSSQMPPIEEENGEDDFNIQSLIDNTEEIKKRVPSKIRLAMYDGLKELDLDQRESAPEVNHYGGFPMSYVETLIEYYPIANTARYLSSISNNSFRLKYMYDNIYNKTTPIDSRKTYKLTFLNKRKLNLMDKFIANNKAFRCFKIERTVTANGFEKHAVGEFYPYVEEKK